MRSVISGGSRSISDIFEYILNLNNIPIENELKTQR